MLGSATIVGLLDLAVVGTMGCVSMCEATGHLLIGQWETCEIVVTLMRNVRNRGLHIENGLA